MIEFLKLKIKELQLQIQIITLQIRILIMKKNFENFALALRIRESSNNYQAVNAYGFLGAYQFGLARLSDLGYTERKPGVSGYANSSFQWRTGYSKEYFLSNPDFQDRVFKEHADNLITQIKAKLTDYLGKQINGTEITLSGLVAGAHLAGVNGVSSYLKGHYDNQDAFGTKVSSYIKAFANYNLENV